MGEQDSARGPLWVSRTRGHLACGHLTMLPEFGATQQTLTTPAPERGSSGHTMVQDTLLQRWHETNACAELPQDDAWDYEENEG